MDTYKCVMFRISDAKMNDCVEICRDDLGN